MAIILLQPTLDEYSISVNDFYQYTKLYVEVVGPPCPVGVCAGPVPATMDKLMVVSQEGW